MNYLSVCSGIEAATVAWYPLGWNPIAFSEIENFPAQVLTHHYPNTPNWGDMTKFKEWPNADVNVLVGGTPCQSFSVAGLRKGLDDPRGNLMLTYLAIADRYRPEWVVWENVPGVLSSNGGRDFASFLRGLAELGYGFAYRILDAQFFGVAQRRRRVFVVGHIRDWQRAAAVLFERHSLQGHPAPRREAGKRTAASLRTRAPASGGQGSDAEHCVANTISAHTGIKQPDFTNYLPWPAEIAPTLDTHYGDKMGLENQHINAGAGLFVASTPTKQDEQPYIVGTIGARTGLSIGAQDAANGHIIPTIGGGFDVAACDVADSLTVGANQTTEFVGDVVAHSLTRRYDSSDDGTGRGTPLVPIQNALRGKSQNGLGIGEGGEPMYTLDKSTTPAVHHAMQVRRLTPRECERLQGFPDDYTLVPYRKKPAADGPRYKALGNSMAVPVMRWIGERIKQVEGL